MSKTSSDGRRRIAVMFGGRSVEHEISIITALQLIEAMDPVSFEPVPVYVTTEGRWYTGSELLKRDFYKGLPGSLEKLKEVVLMPYPSKSGLTVLSQKKKSFLPEIMGVKEPDSIAIDFFIQAFHGSYGEDGCIQGLFELADVAYVGCNVVSASMGMNKYHCKMFLKSHDIPVLPAVTVDKEEIDPASGGSLTKVKERILSVEGLSEYPLFIKPASLGSSIGLSKAKDEKELDAAIIKAFKYDSVLMVEPCLEDKMEINISVMEGQVCTASVVEIPVSEQGGELTYEDKYIRGGGKKSASLSQGMASLTRIIDPEDLDRKYKQMATDYALKIFKTLGCAGVARIDLMLDTKNDVLYFNEINTLPGSMAFYLWAKSDPLVLYTDMITQIIDRAQLRQRTKSALERKIGFNALFK